MRRYTYQLQTRQPTKKLLARLKTLITKNKQNKERLMQILPTVAEAKQLVLEGKVWSLKRDLVHDD